jgi:hypothetical protein
MHVLQYAPIILFVLSMGFGFYVNMLYHKLKNNDVIATNKRISLKILDRAIKEINNKIHLQQLLHCRKLYSIYLFCFYSAILLILFTIAYQSIHPY